MNVYVQNNKNSLRAVEEWLDTRLGGEVDPPIAEAPNTSRVYTREEDGREVVLHEGERGSHVKLPEINPKEMGDNWIFWRNLWQDIRSLARENPREPHYEDRWEIHVPAVGLTPNADKVNVEWRVAPNTPWFGRSVDVRIWAHSHLPEGIPFRCAHVWYSPPTKWSPGHQATQGGCYTAYREPPPKGPFTKEDAKQWGFKVDPRYDQISPAPVWRYEE